MKDNAEKTYLFKTLEQYWLESKNEFAFFAMFVHHIPMFIFRLEQKRLAKKEKKEVEKNG